MYMSQGGVTQYTILICSKMYTRYYSNYLEVTLESRGQRAKQMDTERMATEEAAQHPESTTRC